MRGGVLHPALPLQTRSTSAQRSQLLGCHLLRRAAATNASIVFEWPESEPIRLATVAASRPYEACSQERSCAHWCTQVAVARQEFISLLDLRMPDRVLLLCVPLSTVFQQLL